MNEKELKKISRRDLLEIMLAQTERIENLEKENKQLKRDLNDKRISFTESGSLAEASIKVCKLFEDADKAIKLYKTNYEEQLEKELEKKKKDELKKLEKYCEKKKKEADRIVASAKKSKVSKKKKKESVK